MTGTETPTTTLPPLRRNRNFVRLWIGAGISRFGSTVSMVALPLLALYVTGSAAQAGLVGFAATLPNFLIQLPAGALIDRWDRRTVMIRCDIAGFLALASVAVAAGLHHVWLPHLMLAAFVESSRGVFYDLAERATVRNVVAPEQLSSALAQNEARGSAIGLAGQPGSGALLTLARWLPFAFTAVAHVIGMCCILFIRTTFRPPQPQRKQRLHVDIREGIVWIWRNRFARVLIALFAVSNFIFQMMELSFMVIIRGDGHSPTVVGLVTAVGGLGGMAGAMLAPAWSRRFSLYVTFSAGMVVWAVLVPIIAFVRGPVELAAILAGIAVVTGVFNVVAWTYQLKHTPEHLQGRVNGAARFLSSGANSLGSLSGGFLLQTVGITWTGMVMGGGIALLAVWVITSSATREPEPRLTDNP